MTSITVYAGTHCDDTERTIAALQTWNIAFDQIVIDDNDKAQTFVAAINGGYLSTPTVVIDQGKVKQVITEPTDDELKELLIAVGYQIPDTQLSD
jgi:glutaredoxin